MKDLANAHEHWNAIQELREQEFIDDEDLYDTLKYGDTLSAEDLGFPVDSYGLLMVDDE